MGKQSEEEEEEEGEGRDHPKKLLLLNHPRLPELCASVVATMFSYTKTLRYSRCKHKRTLLLKRALRLRLTSSPRGPPRTPTASSGAAPTTSRTAAAAAAPSAAGATATAGAAAGAGAAAAATAATFAPVGSSRS
jgi:hypothetical protein